MPSADEIPFGIDRVLRRRLEGGERDASKMVLGPVAGPTLDLKTEKGRKLCTDMRERRFEWTVLLPPALTGLVWIELCGGEESW